MLERCYCETYTAKHPTYKDCHVCDEWLTYSNFKNWMTEQEQFHHTITGMQLDKDLIDPTNKIYSPDKCAFVSKKVNTFITTSTSTKNKYPLGVRKLGGRYNSRCRDPFSRRDQISLGVFDTPEEAHEAWLRQKHIFACQLADEVKDPRAAEALRVRYTK